MKRFQYFACLGLVSLGFARGSLVQKPIVYKDNAKDPRMIIQGNEGFLVPGESFELTGNVQIKRIAASSAGKVETLMTCGKAFGNLVKVNAVMEVDKVRMTGGIKFTQSGDNSSTTASGDSAEYDLNNDLREVNINGEVNISFGGNGKKETIGKDGKREQATISSTMNTSSREAKLVFKNRLDDKKRKISELQSAIIRGPIQFHGTQLVKDSAGEKLQKVFAKADRMTYSISGESKNPEVRLEGNLEFREVDNTDEGAMVEGASLLILQLNDKNEIVKLKFTSGIGQKIKTTITRDTTANKKGGA